MAIIVDEVHRAGPPDILRVEGKGTDMRKALKEQKTRSWSNITLGDLLNVIAKDHELVPRINEALAGKVLEHIDQNAESDLHLLKRLANDYGATFRPSVRHLAFVTRGKQRTATGAELPTQAISRTACASWAWSQTDRSRFVGVVAKWHNLDTASEEVVTVGDADGSPISTIPRKFSTEAAA